MKTNRELALEWWRQLTIAEKRIIHRWCFSGISFNMLDKSSVSIERAFNYINQLNNENI